MSSRVQNTPNRAAFDVTSAQDVKAQFRKDPQSGLKAAAQQFEAMFLQMVMKSMRDATPQDDMLSSDSTRFYTSLLDQQMAQNMASGKGIGFAQLIEKQLGKNLATEASAGTSLSLPANSATESSLPAITTSPRHIPSLSSAAFSSQATQDYVPAKEVASTTENSGAPETARQFVNRVWPGAVEASRQTGIPPQFLVAQSALETGWGKSEIRKSDGSSSYNLFGIKAGKGWTGATVEANTTEYINGEARQVKERFRAYSSYEESFRDYARLLRSNSRYSEVIGSQDGTEFARRLQQAGYATDPMYSDKLSRIINGPTLRQALIG